jgi:hypothetical protein
MGTKDPLEQLAAMVVQGREEEAAVLRGRAMRVGCSRVDLVEAGEPEAAVARPAMLASRLVAASASFYLALP